MRGVAALWVVLFHVWFFTGESDLPFGLDGAFKVGWLGVHLFYALSAFLLGGYLMDRKHAPSSRFWKRRFLRIFPAYYAQLVILVAAAPVISMTLPPDPASWLAHLVMAFHLPPFYVQPINGVWWTLPIEFAFYLLLPTLLLALRAMGPWAFAGVAVVITLGFRYAVFVSLEGQPAAVIATRIEQFPGVLTVFVAGLLAARWVRVRPAPPWLGIPAIVAGAVWIALLLGNLETYWEGGPMLWTFGTVNAIFIAILIAAIHRTRGWVAHRVGVWLGEVSYGIYLWHLPVILAWRDAGLEPGFWPGLLITLPPTLLLAWLSFRFVELPAMRWGHRRPTSIGSARS